MKKIIFMLFVTLSLAACSSEVEVNEFDYPLDTYDNATITQVETEDTEAVIRLTVEGFRGDITVMVTVDNNIITDFVVTNHEESDNWGRILIEESTFIQDIIDNSSTLNDITTSDYVVDTDSGATASVTGQALLDAASVALEHYIALYE